MKFGIIGAMESEVAILKSRLVDPVVVNYHGTKFYQGQLEGQSVVLVQSGIGKVNATICATLLVERFKVNYLLNTGIAGAVDPSLEVGDVVIADSLIHHDVDVTAFGYEVGQMAGMPTKYYPDTFLKRLAQQAVRSLEIEPILGLIVSGDEFIQDNQRIKDLRQHFLTARVTDMESAAIAQVAYVLDIPFAIIRVVSDGADDEATLTYEQFSDLAAKISSQMTLQMLNYVTNELEGAQ